MKQKLECKQCDALYNQDPGSSPKKNQKGKEGLSSRLGCGGGKFTTSWALLGLASRKESSSN